MTDLISGENFLERPRWTCALGGALAAAGNLPDTVPILHAGPGCAGNFAWTNNGAAGLAVTGPCLGLSVPATNLQESEVVFGGIERLREEILETIEIMEGGLYFIITGCLPEVIGDDVSSLATELNSTKHPVVLASTPGFKGDSYLGYGEVLKTLVKDVVRKGTKKNPKLVNVWGVPPSFDPFWRGNLLGIRELVGLLGYEANVLFGPEANLNTIKSAAGAKKNIVVSGLYGQEAAELFSELHGVDYVEAPLPFGAAASERFLEILGQALKVPKKTLKEAVSGARERRYSYLEPLIDVYNDMEAQRHVLVVGDANYALSLADFFSEDLGWVPELVVVTNSLAKAEKEKLLAFHKKTGGQKISRLIFENRAHAIREKALEVWNGNGKKYYDSKTPIFVAGSSLERSLASELGAGHLSLCYPVSNRAILNRGFTGHFGGLTLMEDLVSVSVAGR
ncbi:MAG: hypothetical protein LBE38_00905 [Deltaproteobacteria bacterium]|jgi:nitrogenase molybdenum-iron protein beta chain|nr:hypothetical protein [Deltaproteobacteria bacterium]